MTLKDPGKLIYKCRLCRTTHRPTGVPSITLTMACVATNTPVPKEWDGGGHVSILELHNCDDGRIGLSDLIGAERD